MSASPTGEPPHRVVSSPGLDPSVDASPKASIDASIERLPHRPPMRLVQHIIELVEGVSARTTRRAAPGDWYFDGHFPGRPVVPAIALVELLAQTGGLAAASSDAARVTSYRVAAFGSFKFPAPAHAGALLDATALVTGKMGTLVKIEGRVTADGQLVAAGSLTLADVGASDESFGTRAIE